MKTLLVLLSLVFYSNSYSQSLGEKVNDVIKKLRGKTNLSFVDDSVNRFYIHAVPINKVGLEGYLLLGTDSGVVTSYFWARSTSNVINDQGKTINPYPDIKADVTLKQYSIFRDIHISSLGEPTKQETIPEFRSEFCIWLRADRIISISYRNGLLMYFEESFESSAYKSFKVQE